MTGSKRQIKVMILVVMIAGLSMGNESCQQAATKERVLKMDVELGSLRAHTIRLPNGEVVDFPYVVNSLFYRQVMNNDHFVIANPVPSPTSVASTSSGGFGQSKASGAAASISQVENISHEDEKVLSSFGFMDQLRGQVLSEIQGPKGSASKSTATDSSKLPACLYDLPQAQLGGEMITFEATWGVGVGIGYGQGGAPLPGGIGGHVDFSSSRLELGLRTDDPLTQNTVAIADGISHQSNVKFGVDFTAGLPIGLNFFFNTPLADVIRNAMDNGLGKLIESYKTMLSARNSWDDVWESRVLYDPVIANEDTHIAFRAGYRAGVQVGDKFTITNIHYLWEGAACYTRLKYKIPLTTTPIAEAEVVTVGDNVSVARVKYLVEQRILPGAQVKVLELKKPLPAKSTKSAK